LRAIAGAAAGIGAIACILIGAGPRPSQSAETALPALEAAARPGDLVVATVSFYLPARLARDRGRLAGELHAFPADQEDHPGWFLPKSPSDADYRRLGEDIARAGAASSVLLLLDRLYWNPRIGRMLEERGSVKPVAASPDWVLVASVRLSTAAFASRTGGREILARREPLQGSRPPSRPPKADPRQ
jgi:hypothetical protein